MTNKTSQLVTASMFAALCCVATMVLHIPTPGTGGYIHPGDALVILSGIFLGPVYGFLAAGIGSALADMLFGYYIYVPATFVIKGLMAFVCSIIFAKLSGGATKKGIICIVCGVLAAVIMVCGYLGYELILYGSGAIASVPANIVQGVAGIVFSTVLYPVVSKIFALQANLIQEK